MTTICHPSGVRRTTTPPEEISRIIRPQPNRNTGVSHEPASRLVTTSNLQFVIWRNLPRHETIGIELASYLQVCPKP